MGSDRERFDDEFEEARQRLGLVRWHLEEIEDTLSVDHPDAADLAAELAEGAEALEEILGVIDVDRTGRRWDTVGETAEQ